MSQKTNNFSQGQYVESANTVVQNNITINSGASPNVISSVLHLHNDDNCWEPVSFSNQVGLEHAIMGYRLLPSSVDSCPRLPQHSLANGKLDIAHYVFITGEPGCGKSITAYQLAHEYHQDGWLVLKLSYECGCPMHLDTHAEKTVFIIDDAQLFSDELITRLISETNERKKLIITKTKSYRVGEDTVLLLNRQAVDAIYEHYLANKSEIIDLIIRLNKAGGRPIGDRITDTSFEFALSVAKKEKNPWLFNYSLRGGWGNVSYLFEVAKENDRADILLALISLRQILTLDKPIEIQWLYCALSNFGYSIEWCDRQLVFLCDQKQIASMCEIRAIHLEMANRVVAKFYSNASQREQDAFVKVVQKAFQDYQTPLLGYVWFYNAFTRYEMSFKFFHSILTDDIYQELLTRCLSQTTSDDRKQAAFVMEGILNRKYKLHELIEENPILIQWLNCVDSTTAYAYSKILNGVNNELHQQQHGFVSILNLNEIMKQMKQIEVSSLYEWASFLNRLSCLCYRKSGSQIANALPKQEVRKAIASVDNDHLYEAFEMLCSLALIDQAFTFSEYDALFPKIAQALNNDFIGTLDQIDLNFLMYIFGLGLLRKSYPNELQKKAASRFAMYVTPEMLAKCIETGTPHNWHSLYEVWGIVSKYNNETVKAVMDNIDLAILDNTTYGMWNAQEHGFILMLFMLYDSNRFALDEWIFSKRDILCEISMPLASMSIRTLEHVFKRGDRVHLIWNSHSSFADSACLLSVINKHDQDLCLGILEQNTSSISNAFLNLDYIDCDSFHYFFKMIIKVKPEIIDFLCPTAKEINQLKVGWLKIIRDERFRKSTSREHKGFKNLLLLVKSNTTNQDLLALVVEFEALM